jgi:hypothetical protein
MPDEWKKSLQTSMITKEEAIQNPQAVLDALTWFDQIQRNQSKLDIVKYMQFPSDKSMFNIICIFNKKLTLNNNNFI